MMLPVVILVPSVQPKRKTRPVWWGKDIVVLAIANLSVPVAHLVLLVRLMSSPITSELARRVPLCLAKPARAF